MNVYLTNDLNREKRKQLIDRFLNSCDSHDLFYIESILNDLKADFLKRLPPEVVDCILKNVDGASLMNCTRVNKNWHEIIIRDNRLWYQKCLELTDCDEYENDINYYNKFKYLNYKLNRLQSLSETIKFGHLPFEILGMSFYNEKLALAFSGSIKFLRVTKEVYQWIPFKTIPIELSPICFKFNDQYLLIANHFCMIDIYSMETLQLINQIEGHSSSVSVFDFNSNLIVSASFDETLRFWSIDWDKSYYLIEKFDNKKKVINVKIEPFYENIFLVFELDANDTLKIYKIEQSETLKLTLLYEESSNYLVNYFFNQTDKTLRLFYTKPQSEDYHTKKIKITKENIKQFESNRVKFYYDDGHKAESLKLIDFGTRYCILLNGANEFYVANIVNEKKCNLKKLFFADSSYTSTPEYFQFGDRKWLNGFNMNSNENGLIFAYCTTRKNFICILSW